MFYLALAVAGLGTGGAYALLSLGMVTIYKGSRVVNFAQGAVGMVGTFVFANWVTAGKAYWAGVVLGVLTSAVLGLVLYLAVIFPLRRRSGLARMIATFGIVLLLEGFAALHWGSATTFVRSLSSKSWSGGGLSLTGQTLVLVVVALAATVVLSYYFSRTLTGRATDAAATSVDAASVRGLSVTVLGAVAWVIGSALAGVAGILIVPTLGLDSTGLTLVVIGAMVGALVGSFSHIWIAVVSSLALGIIEGVLTGAFPSVLGLSDAAPVVIILLVLLADRRRLSSPGVQEDALPVVPRGRLRTPWMVVAAGLTVWGLIQFNSFWLALTLEAAGLAIVSLSIVLVLGYAGQISLMQWPLAGVGAFIMAFLSVEHHWPVVPAIIVGALVAGAIALVVGIPALRLRGITLAIATLSAGIAIQSAMFSQFNGGSGYDVPVPGLFGQPIGGRTLAIISLVLVAIIGTVLFYFRRSWTGKRLLAVRSSERAALAAGLESVRFKVLAFGAAGMLAGLGGAIWVLGTSTVQTASFDEITSLAVLSIVFINGVGSVAAGIVAGFVSAMGPTFLTDILHVNGLGWFDVISGIALILTTILNPDGALVHEKARRATGDSQPKPMARILRRSGLSRAGAAARQAGQAEAPATSTEVKL